MPKIVVGRDDDDMKKYGTQGTMLMGKHLVGTGEDAHMTTPVLMDALRPHIIILTGKRGEGKCILPKSKVLLSDGRHEEIQNIFSDINGGMPEKSEEFLKSGKDVFVLSTNEKLEIVEKRVSHAYCKLIDEHLISIQTRGGKCIKTTKEHPLLAMGMAASGNL